MAKKSEQAEGATEQASNDDMVTLSNKLTVKALGINPGELIKTLEVGQTVVVARMYGQATKYKVSQSKFSNDGGLPREEVKFLGNFEGVNTATGQVVNASGAYMPNAAATDALRAAVDAAEGGAVEFAVEIAIQKIVKKDGTDGYQFGVAIPRNPAAADPLAAIREKMAARPLAIAAPKKD